MRTARSSSRPEGGGVSPPGTGTPPGTRHPPCEQNDKQVQNITLPQTSFVGGNNDACFEKEL